jgi:hypothetical protein
MCGLAACSPTKYAVTQIFERENMQIRIIGAEKRLSWEGIQQFLSVLLNGPVKLTKIDRHDGFCDHGVPGRYAVQFDLTRDSRTENRVLLFEAFTEEGWLKEQEIARQREEEERAAEEEEEEEENREAELAALTATSEARHCNRQYLTTAGPYTVEPINNGAYYQITTDDSVNFWVVAATHCDDDPRKQFANAHLLAASWDFRQLADKLRKFFCLLPFSPELQGLQAELTSICMKADAKITRCPRPAEDRKKRSEGLSYDDWHRLLTDSVGFGSSFSEWIYENGQGLRLAYELNAAYTDIYDAYEAAVKGA